jgi:hypothetical protein
MKEQIKIEDRNGLTIWLEDLILMVRTSSKPK